MSRTYTVRFNSKVLDVRHSSAAGDSAGGDLYFNISHSQGVAVCAFSKTQEIGIDIEYCGVARFGIAPHHMPQWPACTAKKTRKDHDTW